MEGIFLITLIVHVVAGLIGFMASYAILMSLFRRESSLRTLRISSLTAFLSYLVSWFAGGYYYVVRYGSEVKPIIKAGDYSWAHSFFMETKEHVFLFLPILTFVLVLVFFLSGEKVVSKSGLKRAVTYLAALVAILALFITVSGILVSGGVR